MKITGERVFFDHLEVSQTNDGYLPARSFVYDLTARLIVDGFEIEVKMQGVTKTRCDAILERIYPAFKVLCKEIDFG